MSPLYKRNGKRSPLQPTGVRGGHEQIFIRGGSALRSNTLPFHIPFFTKKVALSYTFYWQMVPLSHTLFKTAVNALSFK